jgi:hypothetical protein
MECIKRTYILTNLFHGAVSFLRNTNLCSGGQEIPAFYGHEVSLPGSQEVTTEPYP